MNIKIVKVGYLDTNCYILEKNNKCLIIDPGAEENKIIENINGKICGILITHNHFDHISALKILCEYYNTCFYDFRNLKEGINIIDDFNFIVKYNLGHTMDSISYIFENIMFCGDFIFKGSIGRCDLGGDFIKMKESIKDILNSSINYKIYPGHGDYTYLDNERKNLEKIIK